MAGRRGVENDVVIFPLHLLIRNEIGKLIECRNFYGARAGKLFFHVRERGLRQQSSIGCNDAFAVFGGSLQGVEVCDSQVGNLRNRRALVGKLHSENVLQIGGGVGADQKYATTAICEGYCRGAGKAGFPNAALAGEEEVLGRVDLIEAVGFHISSTRLLNSRIPRCR
ncbi:hypothetical protein SDC9_199825 [bioreactor metagenome]|uniref:Uncharacterized protein n=1 Tax=bioreactor metagenome TaxID=1076179 RepID=A0A645ILK0_9ZZZZ